MHLKRWLTGIIAIPLLIYVIGPGPRWLFYVILYLVSIAGLVEFYRITSSNLPRFVRWSTYFLTLALYMLIYRRQVLFAPVLTLLWALTPMAYFMFTQPSPEKPWATEIGKAVLGPVYICIPISMVLHMDRFIPGGNLWIFLLLTSIFANDTGAFYFGKLFGRHKLYERVSPNKTWEGAIGGLALSVVASFWFMKIFHIHAVNLKGFILVLSMAVSGQIGDLAESMLKRNQGIKDSGGILPGHGGMLDRIDALLFAIPILYVYLSISIV